jgi:hypothetical protein
MGAREFPATMSAISDAVRWAEEIMKEVDSRGPSKEMKIQKDDCDSNRDLSPTDIQDHSVRVADEPSGMDGIFATRTLQ